MIHEYKYKAHCVRVVDGDTIYCDIDLGFGVWLHKQIIRLAGIDTPEIRGEEREEGLKVKEYVEAVLMNKELILETYKYKKGKYGRWIAEIWYKWEEEYINLNSLLLEQGMATEVKYGR